MATDTSDEARTIKRGLARKSNRHGRETIEAIAQAAMQILIEEGASRLTFAHLATRTGLTKGAIMYHFPSKEALLEHLIGMYRERLERRLRVGELEASISESPVTDETVAGFIEWYRTFRGEQTSNTAFGLSVLSLTTKNERMREVLQGWYRGVFERVGQSPCGVDALIAVLALEGLFYLRHFRMDMIEEQDVERVLEVLEARCSVPAQNARDMQDTQDTRDAREDARETEPKGD